MRMSHSHIAVNLRTCSLHALNESTIHLFYQKFLPTICTKLMPTLQTILLIFTLIKLRVAYTAKTLVLSRQSKVDERKVFWQRRIKFYAYLIFQFIFLIKPICQELVAVPFVMLENLYRFVRIAIKHILDFLNFIHLSL
jgi:hypothetical protein